MNWGASTCSHYIVTTCSYLMILMLSRESHCVSLCLTSAPFQDIPSFWLCWCSRHGLWVVCKPVTKHECHRGQIAGRPCRTYTTCSYHICSYGRPASSVRLPQPHSWHPPGEKCENHEKWVLIPAAKQVQSLLACEISSCVTSGCLLLGSGRHLHGLHSRCTNREVHKNDRKKRCTRNVLRTAWGAGCTSKSSWHITHL